MKVSIFIVSHPRDYSWLRYCLKSIEKFATGFHEICLMIPDVDTGAREFIKIVSSYVGQAPLRIVPFDEWPGKGMMHHEWLIVSADKHCPDADFILHTDSDCIFIETVQPSDYFVGDKPVLIYATYDWVVRKFRNENYRHWKTATQNAIGGINEFEFMRRHPAVHARAVYSKTRGLIAIHTGKEPSAYVRSCRDAFPHEFCEFVTLGEVAWRHFRKDYYWLNQAIDHWPKDKLAQFWGHGPLNVAQDVALNGGHITMVPQEFIDKVLG